MIGPCTGSLLSRLPASGDGRCRADKTYVTKEALSRLPALDVRDFARCGASSTKPEAAPRLSRELLMRAVAYRMQELARAGCARSCSASCTRSPRSCSKPEGHDTPAPSAEARNAVAAGMAGSKPRGAGAR